jgi:hypothetical protein
VGLRFDLAEAVVEPEPVKAGPGMDPDKPPNLR